MIRKAPPRGCVGVFVLSAFSEPRLEYLPSLVGVPNAKLFKEGFLWACRHIRPYQDHLFGKFHFLDVLRHPIEVQQGGHNVDDNLVRLEQQYVPPKLQVIILRPRELPGNEDSHFKM